MKLNKFEISLIIAMFLTLGITAFAETSFENMSDKMIRFHVLANSNEQYDQNLKLLVRDEVFDYASEITSDIDDKSSAYDILSQNLYEIEMIATNIVHENGYDYSVDVSLEQEYYPQKDYEDFSLPAGQYLGLKVKIGKAEGDNWWCVVFPPLCNQLAYDTKNLTDEEIDFITNEDYQIKFKVVDIYQNVKKYIS